MNIRYRNPNDEKTNISTNIVYFFLLQPFWINSILCSLYGRKVFVWTVKTFINEQINGKFNSKLSYILTFIDVSLKIYEIRFVQVCYPLTAYFSKRIKSIAILKKIMHPGMVKGGLYNRIWNDQLAHMIK